MRRLATLAQIIAILSGCQISAEALKPSSTPRELSKEASSAMANDIVGRLAEQIRQSDATIYLKKDEGSFGKALNRALIEHGYAVTTKQPSDDKKPAIPLTYNFDEIDGQRLAWLSMKDMVLARAYSITANGAVPVSPISVIRNGG